MNVDIIDCTSDPHTVHLDDINEITDLIMELCKSEIIKYIYSVKLTFEKNFKIKKCYYSGIYNSKISDRKKLSQEYVKENKLAGPYYHENKYMKDIKYKKIPPGLSGIEYCLKIIRPIFTKRLKYLKDITEIILRIQVKYEIFGDHSEYDEIRFYIYSRSAVTVINDWNYIEHPKYNEFNSQLIKFFYSKNLYLKREDPLGFE